MVLMIGFSTALTTPKISATTISVSAFLPAGTARQLDAMDQLMRDPEGNGRNR